MANSIPACVWLTVFDPSDLPDHRHGMTLYRGVIVCWDEDRDTRVLRFIDSCLTEWQRSQLVAVREHEGSLILVWSDISPPFVADRDDFEVDGDVWSVMESRTLRPLRE